MKRFKGDRPTVIKVGGSLLGWAELKERLGEFLRSEIPPDFRIVLIAGGGEIVEAIRRLDQVHHLGDVEAHFLAIRALDLTGEILSNVLKRARLVANLHELETCWGGEILPVLAPYQWVRQGASGLVSELPASWEVTSDSIAAWIAQEIDADRLILLKSADAPPGTTRTQASLAGFVDSMLPTVSRRLNWIGFRNLRNSNGTIVELPE